MKKFKIRIYLNQGSPIEVVIEAKTEGMAIQIVKAQYGSNFKSIAHSQEIK